MSGFAKTSYGIGTVYTNTTLNNQSTGVNVANGAAITLPATPTPGQVIAVNNVSGSSIVINGAVGNGTSLTIPAPSNPPSMAYGNNAYGNLIDVPSVPTVGTPSSVWAWVPSNCYYSMTAPPALDYGKHTFSGPFASPPTPPPNTSTTRTVWTSICGQRLIETHTTTYTADIIAVLGYNVATSYGGGGGGNLPVWNSGAINYLTLSADGAPTTGAILGAAAAPATATSFGTPLDTPHYSIAIGVTAVVYWDTATHGTEYTLYTRGAFTVTVANVYNVYIQEVLTYSLA